MREVTRVHEGITAMATKDLPKTPYFIKLEPILGVSNPEGGNRALSISESGLDTKTLPKNPYFIELEPILGVSNPEGGNRALSIRIRGRSILESN